MSISPKKSHILYYFLKLRFSRIFSSNKVSPSRKKQWKANLLTSPFYKKLITTDGEYPIMNKASFMENFDTINTVGITKEAAFDLAIKSEQSRDFSPAIKNVSVGLSSGTSGNKGIFLTTRKEKTIWIAAVLDRVIGFSLQKRKVAFFLRANNNLYESVKSAILAFTFFDTKTPIEQHIDKLIALDANILVAQPSVLNEIARHYEQRNIKAFFSKILSVAEVLEADQKEYFEKVFKTKIDQIYQCTEGFLAYTCKNGQLHFNEDWLTIEKKYLDENQTRFYPIITDHLRVSQPVVRYELNDIIQEGPMCSCGSKSTVIAKIEGRADDVFRFNKNGKTVIIYPDFIRRAVIISANEVSNYVIAQTDENEISVSLEVTNNSDLETAFEKIKTGLTNMLSEFGVGDVAIIRVERKHNFMNKFTRIKGLSN